MLIWQFVSSRAFDALDARNDFLATLQKHFGPTIDEYAAKVIFTELVANVVRHAPGRIVITLKSKRSAAVLTVADAGTGFEFATGLPLKPYDGGGRGLFIVSQYAGTVSVTRPDGAGASVSATLPLKGPRLKD